MKNTELRIGNWVFDKPVEKEITIDFGDMLDEHGDTDYYDPIPLTEEWLLKLGFKGFDNMKYKFLNKATDHELRIDHLNDNHCYLIRGSNKIFINEIPFVHQLQNLYFALTGEELKIEDK